MDATASFSRLFSLFAISTLERVGRGIAAVAEILKCLVLSPLHRATSDGYADRTIAANKMSPFDMVVNAVASDRRYSRIAAHEAVAPVVGDMTPKRSIRLSWGNTFLARAEVDRRIRNESF